MAFKEIVLPFDGFYDTYHGEAIDNFVESQVVDEGRTQCWASNFDYQRAYKLYALEYVEKFNQAMKQRINGQWCDLTLRFKEVESPREYNFTNDKIVAIISDKMIGIMMARVDWQDLTCLVRDTFTSYDGFISFYPADIGDWDNWTQWDHNQLSIAMQSWCELELGEGWHYRDIEILTHEVLGELL